MENRFANRVLRAVLTGMLVIAVLGAGPANADSPSAIPGKRPLDADGRMRVSEGDRCPVCAMEVIRHPKFASAIALKDGRTFYFCGTGCMIRTWLHPEVFLGVPPEALDRPIVHDYFTGREVDARRVIWVAGSDVVGPMGPALVPIAEDSHVEAFQRRHGGDRTFRLDELDDAAWTEITGKPAVPEKQP